MSVNNTCAISSSISFLTSAAIPVFTERLRAEHNLGLTADSREQTQKAIVRPLTTQLRFRCPAHEYCANTLGVKHLPRRSLATAGRSRVERWAFSSEIGRTYGAASRVSRQSDSRGEWIQNPAQPGRIDCRRGCRGCEGTRQRSCR